MLNTSTSQESNKKEEQVSLTKASEVLMPDENVLGEPDDISSAIVKKISDDVEDARTLREYRMISAVVLGGTAALFYVLLILFIGLLVWCPAARYFPLQSPTVCIVVLLILSVVPTLLTLCVAKAVFGRKAQVETPFAPLHAIFQLMKDMKS